MKEIETEREGEIERDRRERDRGDRKGNRVREKHGDGEIRRVHGRFFQPPWKQRFK